MCDESTPSKQSSQPSGAGAHGGEHRLQDELSDWVVGVSQRPSPDDDLTFVFHDEHDAVNFAYTDRRLVGQRISVWRRDGITYTTLHRLAR